MHLSIYGNPSLNSYREGKDQLVDAMYGVRRKKIPSSLQNSWFYYLVTTIPSNLRHKGYYL